MDDIYNHALRLLSARDYTVAKLQERLRARFGNIPAAVIDDLVARNYLNDRRYAENYIALRRNRGPVRLRQELKARGVLPGMIDEILSERAGTSLHEALNAKMKVWKMEGPLHPRQAARLFRALSRLGYEEDEIIEAFERLNEK